MTASGAEAALFWVLAPLMVLAALGLLFARKAVHAAVCVMFVMVGLAILYVAQEAPFLGVVQVVVYTGAVMMLFLFVLMLVGVDSADSLTETIRGQRWLGVLLGLGLVVVLLGVIAQAAFPPAVGLAATEELTNPVALARVLLGDYVLAMEVVGVLLVTAALAGLVLTHRRRLSVRPTQRVLAAARVAALPQGSTLTPLPAPGVYAQNNAMDTPALGPDGEPLPHSVPRVLRIRGQERSATAVLAEEETLVARDDLRLLGVGPAADATVEQVGDPVATGTTDAGATDEGDEDGEVR
ncbi:NADH-quinone oxidoreductase subunit J [Isoptericola nanjingensis]|uniref:NADH-quinone oxidoreductase subunit J n=1 Tax=Isoptericola TaxID=254250 RepID=UPI003D1C601E|nr:NADH-quinone oxidoreductase subunit J [Isoptericola sp. QY 916]